MLRVMARLGIIDEAKASKSLSSRSVREEGLVSYPPLQLPSQGDVEGAKYGYGGEPLGEGEDIFVPFELEEDGHTEPQLVKELFKGEEAGALP